MASLYEQLRDDIKTAMKARDSQTTTILRTADAAIKKVSIDDDRDIDDALVAQIMRKSVKNLKGANEQFSKGGREDLIEANNKEIAILEKYLPQMIEGDALIAIVEEAITSSGAQSKKDMGKVMGLLKKRSDAALINFGAVSKVIQGKLP